MNDNIEGIISEFCMNRLGRLPNLTNPSGFTDKMQWLKIHDQMPEHVIGCNKYLARGYVAGIVGEEILLNVYAAARSVDTIDFDTLPERYVLKANHDNGSVFVVGSPVDLERAKKILKKKTRRIYALSKGEWAYAHIVPLVFAEEYMSGPIIDYKFHCCEGRIKLVQIIAERTSGNPIEIVVDKNYKVPGWHFDPKMKHSTSPPQKPNCWEEMKRIAVRLSKPFRFVRVDLYDYQGQPKFGELTFWPMSGILGSKDDEKFGQLMNMDLSYKRPQLHKSVGFSEPERGWIREQLVRIGEKLA